MYGEKYFRKITNVLRVLYTTFHRNEEQSQVASLKTLSRNSTERPEQIYEKVNGNWFPCLDLNWILPQ
jgi:hypothetical protein